MRLLLFTILFYSYLNAGGVLAVDWRSANASQQKPTAAYPTVLTEGIKEVHLPVYLSRAYAYDKKMGVVAGKYFYSISIILNGATVLFEGDRTYQESVSPTNAEFQKIIQKSQAVNVFKSEEMMMAEFNRNGANYTISIECDNPKRDKRCTEEAFVRDLHSSVVMVGGRP